MRMQVVLPQPDGPTMATNSRSCTTRSMSFSATNSLPFWLEDALHALELDLAKSVSVVQMPRRFSIAACARRSATSITRPTTPIATMPHITVAVDIDAWPLTIR